MLTEQTKNAYISILREELVPATGCTEPIALAYCGARLREVLGAVPERILAEISGNIIKNVKSVIVPNTGGMKGIPAAVAAGVIAGDAGRILQVIAQTPEEKHGEIAAYAQNTPIQVVYAKTSRLLDIRLTGWAEGHSALVHIANSHSNIVREERDGEVLLERPVTDSPEDSLTDKACLNVADILAFADTTDLEEISPLLEQQLSYNTAIAEEGLRGDWGANIGSVLLDGYAPDIKTEAKAWAAAGSDARMSGCEMPVVILSGSGNQGMTASVPLARYAVHLGASREKLHRALLVSDLVTIQQKSGIGRLSAYCGAGIAYLLDGSFAAIAHTIVNAVAIISGTICDGAKPSCAAKIAASVDAGILGYHMYLASQEFKSGDGIVTRNVDETIANIGVLAKEGMRETDRTILNIMTRTRC
ncbi:serine dehydratase subunit alpha family protein [Acutalibacter sp. 1XD8-33]|uniref:L-cysteine desulfidase family protein n=1 Tax=Acutalibacter sp. 1XD8-33 TaxID=2320081 RepID=UPI000EA1F634|nr:L-serine ammonia-lyase, iron-sulfur-dependent, subunit alpha [Acutalibacter sp. 1XD8-33]RKJ41340.1 serine dehydratase subunit alpha family protein [Acutalibacter sp. 1XD8-33]